MSASTSGARKRLRFTPVALVTGLLASGLLALTMTGTLSGFIASITNSANTAGSGSLVMEEKSTTGPAATCLSTDGGTVSTNTATCTTINKFGGNLNMAPGVSVSTSITIKNTGTITPATFVLGHGSACAVTPNGSPSGSGTATMCAQLKVKIVSGAATVFDGTAASLAAAIPSAITMPAAPAAGVSIPFTITTTLDPAADNTYQGLSVSLPLTWTFTA
jgi:hypothetical protein